jgi:hypothetical protein
MTLLATLTPPIWAEVPIPDPPDALQPDPKGPETPQEALAV